MENFDKTKIRLLAFDIDGTIFSSEEIILPVYKEAIANYIKKSNIKIPVPTQERIMLEIGKPVKTIFKNLLPELPEPERDKISDDVLRLLCEKIRNGEGHVYPNVFESVKSLREKGFSIAVASNGRLPYVESILERVKILQFFEELVVLDYDKLKTKGDILDHYKKIFSLSGPEILMIGDRSSDRDAAIQSGSPFAFCSYGHAPDGEIENFSIELQSPESLFTALE